MIDDKDWGNLTVEFNVESDIKQMKTPEEVKRMVDIYKNLEKAKYAAADNNHKIIMKNNLGHLLPCHVGHIFDTSGYIVYDNTHSEVNAETDEQAEAAVLYRKKFVESVVVIENTWYLNNKFFGLRPW